MPFVSPFLDVSPGVVMGTPLALVVNEAAVSEKRPVILVVAGNSPNVR